MGAYNTLQPFKIDCPVCGTRSEHQLQFKTAASYAGDQTGRFAFRTYTFGDKLAWWPRSDTHYREWREDLPQDVQGKDSTEERLAVTCSDCRSGLLIVIGFESLYIVGVLDVLPVDPVT